MHPYLKCAVRLRKWLVDLRMSDGGQFEIETLQSGVYRGSVDSWEISEKDGNRILTVRLNWFCRSCLSTDENGVRGMRWSEAQERSAPLAPPTIVVPYRWYYKQVNHDRIKLKSDQDEACRCYPPGHPTNLVRLDDGSIITFAQQQKIIST